MARTKSSETPPRSPLGILFVTVFVDLLGFGIVIPLLPFYTVQFHASALMAGVVLASYSAMQFLFAPFWGSLSDRIGRRPVILLSLFGSTLSYLLFALANGVGLLLISRILAGIMGANIPVAQAVVADSTTGKNRAHGMGMIGAAFGLGFIFGPALGGLLAHYGHRAPGFLAAGICGINLLVAVWRLPETRRARQKVTEIAFGGQFTSLLRTHWLPHQVALMVLFFTAVFAFSNMETTLSLLCASEFHMPATQIYWLFGFLGVVNTIAQGGVVGRLTKRSGENPVIFIGAALLAFALAATPYMRPWWSLLLALGVLAFAQGITSPSLLSLLSKVSVSEEHGATLGVSQSLGSLARILGPLWGGFTFERFSPAAPYVTTAVMLIAALIVCAPLVRAAPTMPAEDEAASA